MVANSVRQSEYKHIESSSISMVAFFLGLVSFFIGFFTAIPTIFISILSLRLIAFEQEPEKDKPFALMGFAFGALALFLWSSVWLFLFIFQATSMQFSFVIYATIAIVINALVCIKLLINYTLVLFLKKIPLECRTIKLHMVWFTMIPIFGIVWNFFVVLMLSRSKKRFLLKLGLIEDRDISFYIGMAYSICCIFYLLPSWGIFFIFPAFILLVVYAVKINLLARWTN